MPPLEVIRENYRNSIKNLTFQDLIGHVVDLPEPHDAVVLIGRQEAQVGHLGGVVLGARPAREEVVDVGHHGLGDRAPTPDHHRGVALQSRVDRQGVEQGPDRARVPSVMGFRSCNKNCDYSLSEAGF